ncbi:MAG: hypothetical protein ACREAL_08700 [Nitrosopumilaceae archaeon]
MIKDKLTWVMVVLGIIVVIGTVYMEFTRMEVWVNNSYHDFALVVFVGISIASLYYGHSRIDHLENNGRFDKIQKELEKIYEDIHEIKKNIQEIAQSKETKNR